MIAKRWPGATFALIGGGPSLTSEDVDAVRCCGCVIAINDAYRLAPWADVLYAADAHWWGWHAGVPAFTGPKYSIEPWDARERSAWPDVSVLRNTGPLGLDSDPTALRSGRNSGYQAINLAVHLGARRLILLGYDMALAPDGREHWFGDHPVPQISPYAEMRAAFESLLEPLAAMGIEILNCSRRSALMAFPRVPLETALQGVAA